MIINKNEVLSTNLDFFDFRLLTHPHIKSDSEHYRLLTYITKNNNNITIIDAGTCDGNSCLALAQNQNNMIITYDIIKKNFPFFNEYKNIVFKQLDINLEDSNILKGSDIILLDIDPHDGKQELKFTNYLTNIKYSGYLLCDDIHLNEAMDNWWNSIVFEKYDITDIGHFSGTGLINFKNDKSVLIYD